MGSTNMFIGEIGVKADVLTSRFGSIIAPGALSASKMMAWTGSYFSSGSQEKQSKPDNRKEIAA